MNTTSAIIGLVLLAIGAFSAVTGKFPGAMPHQAADAHDADKLIRLRGVGIAVAGLGVLVESLGTFTSAPLMLPADPLAVVGIVIFAAGLIGAVVANVRLKSRS